MSHDLPYIPAPDTSLPADPVGDPIEALAAAGARAVIQPGGSVRDAEVIAAADEAGRRSGAGSHVDGLLDDAVTRRRQDDED